jgi:hypothetical protein
MEVNFQLGYKESDQFFYVSQKNLGEDMDVIPEIEQCWDAH